MRIDRHEIDGYQERACVERENRESKEDPDMPRHPEWVGLDAHRDHACRDGEDKEGEEREDGFAVEAAAHDASGDQQ